MSQVRMDCQAWVPRYWPKSCRCVPTDMVFYNSYYDPPNISPLAPKKWHAKILDNGVRVRRCSDGMSAHPLLAIDDAWNIIWEKSFSFDKLTTFIDYFVEQWMDNPNMPIKVWNVCEQRHRTNNSVEGWSSKLNAITDRNQPYVHLLIKILKEETQKVSFNIKFRELGDLEIKRKKADVKLYERIENILKEFETSNNLEKCLNSFCIGWTKSNGK
ncbi:uncharacterized protein TNCV_4554581 [Trichonephila clavipes]|nr:uncharacterized protein TNCV_4554581 [Trichonephila clavipes]